MPVSFLSLPFVSSQRSRHAVWLRGIARILLLSWLFTLGTCFYSNFHQASAHTESAVTHEHLTHSAQINHHDDTQDEDVCCTILDNLPVFHKIGDMQTPLHNLMYVLLPFVFIISAATLITPRISIFYTDPPGKPGSLISANALWPNAPPY